MEAHVHFTCFEFSDNYKLTTLPNKVMGRTRDDIEYEDVVLSHLNAPVPHAVHAI